VAPVAGVAPGPFVERDKELEMPPHLMARRLRVGFLQGLSDSPMLSIDLTMEPAAERRARELRLQS
jgi:hypothetical protein